MTRHAKRAAALVALAFAASTVTAAPADAADDNPSGETWCKVAGVVCDTVWIRAVGGVQADGTGHYLDSVTVRCDGDYEKDPAIVGNVLVVRKVRKDGTFKDRIRHAHLDIDRNDDDTGCARTFTLGKRIRAYNIYAGYGGKARRDGDPDKTFYIEDWVQ